MSHRHPPNFGVPQEKTNTRTGRSAASQQNVARAGLDSKLGKLPTVGAGSSAIVKARLG